MALCDELEQQIDNSQTQIEQLMQSCLKEVFVARVKLTVYLLPVLLPVLINLLAVFSIFGI